MVGRGWSCMQGFEGAGRGSTHALPWHSNGARGPLQHLDPAGMDRSSSLGGGAAAAGGWAAAPLMGPERPHLDLWATATPPRAPTPWASLTLPASRVSTSTSSRGWGCCTYSPCAWCESWAVVALSYEAAPRVRGDGGGGVGGHACWESGESLWAPARPPEPAGSNWGGRESTWRVSHALAS